MKGKYKGCDIELTVVSDVTEESIMSYIIKDRGTIVDEGCSYNKELPSVFYNHLLLLVDDYRSNPETYK